jgi:hypothetical protein
MNPIQRGDVRTDGMVFWAYRKDRGTEHWITNEQYEKYITKQSSKRSRISTNLAVTRYNCKKNNVPFDLDLEYLLEIAVEKCPVFGFELAWNGVRGSIQPNSPSLDRIVPELGYIKGNVRYLSNQANTMKSYATKEQLKQFAEWVARDLVN